MSHQTVWGIHGGRTGDADELFLQKNYVGLGWVDAGDIEKWPANREAYKETLRKIYPQKPKGWFGNAAGQLYRFIHELDVGDIIVYPSKRDRKIHIGEIVGKYEYRTDLEPGYPQIRAVKWLKHVPRTAFSQGALYESGSAMSFFQIKTYADEYLTALEGKIVEIVPPDEEETEQISADIEDQTRDFVIKQLSKMLKGLPFEEFVKHLLEKMGYRVRFTRTNEPSIDLIAHKDNLGFEPPIVKVQVKSSDGKINDKDVSALYGKLGQGEFALLITLGDFTPPAITFANSKSNLRLVDGYELVDLIFEYYEQFDAKYKGILPLKKVYIPEAIGRD